VVRAVAVSVSTFRLSLLPPYSHFPPTTFLAPRCGILHVPTLGRPD